MEMFEKVLVDNQSFQIKFVELQSWRCFLKKERAVFALMQNDYIYYTVVL